MAFPFGRKPSANTNRMARSNRTRLASTSLASIMLATTPLNAQEAPPAQIGRMELAQADNTQGFAIPAQSLTSALDRFSEQTGISFAFTTTQLEGLRSPGVTGILTRREALSKLLAGTGVTFRFTGAATVALERRLPQSGEELLQLDPITIEGETPSALGDHAGRFEVDEGFKAEYQSSATKSPARLRETPQAVSVVTQDLIEARQAITLTQVLETTGATISVQNGPFAGRDAFGFGFTTIRGIEAPPEFGVTQDGFLAPLIRGSNDLAIYERVEVVKGPSSVLYGRGSAGGFINQVTKKPLPEFQTNSAATFGSFDFHRVDADVTGPILESHNVRGRLVLAYEDSGSFIDFVETERVVAAPSIELDLTDSTRLLLQATYQKDKFLPHQGFPLIQEGQNFRAPNVSRSTFFGVPGDSDDGDRENSSGSLQLEQALGDNWLATLRLNSQSLRQSVTVDAYSYGHYSPPGTTYLYSGDSDYDADLWAGELRLNGKVDLFGRQADVTLGMDHSHIEDVRFGRYGYVGVANIYTDDLTSFPVPATLPNPWGNEQDYDGTGVFGQVQYRPIDRLSLLLGGRYDWADTFSDGDTQDNAPGGTKEDEEFTWRFGLVFDATDQISFYGLYAQSFAPNVFSFARDGVLEPEFGETFEAGIKTEWLDGKFGVNAAVFRIDRENVAVSDPTNAIGESFSINAGLQRSDGFELEMFGEPAPGWKLSLSGILLDSEFIERTDPSFGTSPRGVADWQVGFYTSYELQSGPLAGLGVGAGLFAIDDRSVGSAGTISGGLIDGYERVDLQVFYNRFDAFTASLQVRNVFDETYVENLADLGQLNQFGAPRAVIFTLRSKF